MSLFSVILDAVLCHSRSNEVAPRDHEDIKRHWLESLCKKGKKPTGQTGSLESEQTFACPMIQASILKKCEASKLGA